MQAAPRIATKAKVFKLKNRNLFMLKQDLISRNPLRSVENPAGNIIAEGEFGGVLSRAGVGKTALVVQLALNSMLRGTEVLHISLNDSIEKVTLWYREQFQNLAGECNVAERQELWEAILPYRFIMTFRVTKFSVPKLEERLTDLMEQDVFHPSTIMIDGLVFDEAGIAQLQELKTLAVKYRLQMWFTVHTHREEDTTSAGIPVRLVSALDLFDVALELKPQGAEVHIIALKGPRIKGSDTKLSLDPATMLIKDSL